MFLCRDENDVLHPPAESRGTTVDELVLSIDVPATIVSFGGLGVPRSMQGRDLSPLLADSHAEWRDEIFIESLFLLRTGPYMEAVRTKDWKYVRYFRSDKPQYGEEDVDFRGRQPDFEQFFDLTDDPGEEVNLIAEPGLQERIGDFRERCSQHSAALVLARQDTQTFPR